ncbi:MAG TPA: POTRA domain-containing protein, partial [Polyangiaceae bacterium]|nr:POTRA domain-containing protein [Polyangiaceae bacterium]
MQRIYAARCHAWMRFVIVFALSSIAAQSFAQAPAAAGQHKPARPAHTATPAAPAATHDDAAASDSAPTADVGELPSEPPPSAALPPGEAELARGLPLQRIQVTGNRRVTPEDVLTYIRERVGQPFKPETLTQDVRELWNSGFFDDIEVDLDRHDEGVDLRFVVRERPSISAITFEGNEDISKDDLNEGIEIKAATILSLPAVRRTVQKIRDMYAEKGYFLAEVQNEVVPQK